MTRPESASRTIRSRAGLVWLVIAGVAMLALLGDVLLRGGWSMTLRIAPWLLLAAWFLWVFFAAPRVEVRQDGVTVHNPLRITVIPWSAIREISLRWQIAFHLTDGREVQAWATVSRRPHRQGELQPVDRELEILRERLERARTEEARSMPGTDGGPGIRRSWDLPALVALGVLAAWAAAAVLVR